MAASRGMGDCSAPSTARASDNCAAAASGARGTANGVNMTRVVFGTRPSILVSGGGRQQGFQPVECIQRLPRCQPVRLEAGDSTAQLVVRERFVLAIIWACRGREQGQQAQYAAGGE